MKKAHQVASLFLCVRYVGPNVQRVRGMTLNFLKEGLNFLLFLSIRMELHPQRGPQLGKPCQAF